MIFRILGPLEVRGLSFAPRQRTVLSMLLLEANQVVAVDRLVDAVWDTRPPSTAREQIQICVSAIRRALSGVGLPDTVVRQTPGYLIRCAEDDLDLLVFRRLVARAREAVAHDDRTGAAATFRDALALWRGTPLDGVNSDVVDAARTTLVDRRISVVEEHVDVQLPLGVSRELVGELVDLVAANPFRERLRAQLMMALHRDGRRAEALEVYRAGRQLLVDELGLEPGEELARVERVILTGAEPRPRAAETRPVVPRLLPPTSRDFTGRAEAVARIRDLLAPASAGPGIRVVAVDGRAWIGKTMVAVRAAHALREDYPDGQLFVRLGGTDGDPVRPADVLARFLRALGVDGAAVPSGTDERAELYRDLTAERRVLVVLDDASDERQVAPLLPGSPACGVIVTSRRGLTALAGAWHVTVGPLTVGQGAELLTAVIGADRVGAQHRDVRRLAEVCQGEPLALRLAGARLATRPHWPLATQIDRLTAGDDGWRELGRDVEESMTALHRRLTPAACRLLRRTALLGSGGVEFPHRLCAPLLDVPADLADDVLAELVDAGLLEVRRASDGDATCHVGGLVGAYARRRLETDDGPAERRAVLRRVFATRREHLRDRSGGVVVALPTAWTATADPPHLRPANAGW